MKRRVLATLLALCTVLTMLPGMTAAAAGTPDWYFLFAIFKNVDAVVSDGNGGRQHVRYSMSQDEINIIRQNAGAFEYYMNQVGVMRAHVLLVDIDTPVTKLSEDMNGSYISAADAEPLLRGIDLDNYDHVTCCVSLNTRTKYLGLGGSEFSNHTGHSCINYVNQQYALNNFSYEKTFWEASAHVHEFLHFMERMTSKIGADFDLHRVRIDFYMPDGDEGKACYQDIMRNQAKGTAGTGVHPAIWQYSPRVLRNTREFTIPSGASAIGDWAFQDYRQFSKVTIPSSVTRIGIAAFERCTGLAEMTIPSGVTSIGAWAFQGCTALTKVTIPASVTSIEEVAFYKTGLRDVYYGGTEKQWKAISIGGFNETLTKARIHYQSAPSSYTIIFNANGGTCATKTREVPANAAYGTLPTPTRTGYTFSGWYTARSGGKKVTASTKATANATLYARWTKTAAKTYTLTFNANGGLCDTATKKVSANAAYGTLPTARRTGYTLSGWYTSKTGGKKVTSTTKATANATLYARWTKAKRTYQVNFNANGGDVLMDSKTVLRGSTYRDLPTPSRRGYHFTGWYTKSSGGAKITDKTKVNLTANQTLYAHWSTAAVKVTSSKNGNWKITVPPFYNVMLYSSEVSAAIAAYIPEQGSSTQTLSCTKMAQLSNGTTRYYAKMASGKSYWFTYTCEMDVN